MLNTNLTTIRWKKSLYYISEGVIFDIQNIKRTNDMDNCGSFLIDFFRADNVSKNAVVGATVNLTNQTELFTGIPWLEVKFSEPELDISVPLQYLIEEGDTFTLNNVGQSHPNVYDKDYRNKFNQDFFETIRTYVNRTSLNYGETLVNQIMNILPAWLTCDVGVEMTRNYVINSFVKGEPWNGEQAINGNDDVITLTGVTLKTPMGDASISGSWNKEKIENLALVLVAVRDVNKLNISSELMEAMLDLIIENNAQTGNGDKLNSLYHIDYDNVGSIIDFEILAKVTDANTYWQYAAIPEPEIRRVNNIQEFKELGESGYTDDITIDGDVTVAFVPENQIYIMLMDDTGGLVVYNENRVSQTLVADDLIRGIVGKYKSYAGTPEFVPSQNLPNAIEICHTINSIEVNDICNQSLIGKLVTIDVYNESEYQFQYGVVEGMQHNVTQNSNNETIFIRNGFYTINDITLPVGNIKVTGFAWRYNNEHYDEWQIWCRDNNDIQIISEPEIEND